MPYPQHLVFEELHEVRREGTRLSKIAQLALMLCRWYLVETDLFGKVWTAKLLDVGVGYLDAVLDRCIQAKGDPIKTLVAFGAHATGRF
jgi:hypothetical protein